MDAAHLHKINELAREYLRLGIATSTTDAVEKALFQLRMEKKQPARESTPYDVLFEKYKAEKAQAEEARREEAVQTQDDLLPLTPTPHEQLSQSEAYLLRQEIRKLKDEWEKSLSQMREDYARLRDEYGRLAEEYAQLKAMLAQRQAEQSYAEQPQSEQAVGRLSTSIAMQAEKHAYTIKGQPLPDADAVSVEKIFYAGKR